MKVVMVMFDSLNRHFLPCCGTPGSEWVHAPNFQRLADRSVMFDRSYVCSMPCMPARRDFHTARPNFLHNAWGPHEPFDDSVPQMLKQAGVYTHLVTDHYHYWEDGGVNYNTRYNTWEFLRGQGDPCIGRVAEPIVPDHVNGKGRRQDWVNRMSMQREQDQPGPMTFRAGVEFIRRNADEDNWFLQIEAFDPHEPFFCDRSYLDLYEGEYEGPLFDWPPYSPVKDHTPEQVEQIRKRYAALLSNCDKHLGDVLDLFDQRGLWDDTMLIVWTDHGHMLGEHGCFAKNWQPWYEELSHTPFFVWDPRCGKQGETRNALVQPALDLGPTLLDVFGVNSTPRMLGHSLTAAIESDKAVREAGLFGNFGGHVNVTDGRHVYMRATENPDVEINRYTMLPIGVRGREATDQPICEGPAFSFTRGHPLFRLPSPPPNPGPSVNFGTLLFDLETDPKQENPLKDAAIEQRMIGHLKRLMQECEAPPEQYERLGLS